jgi:hypothetical protein
MISHRKNRPGKSPWNAKPQIAGIPLHSLLFYLPPGIRGHSAFPPRRFLLSAFCFLLFPQMSPLCHGRCHGSEVMITLSLLVCHRVTAQRPSDTSLFPVHAFRFPASISAFCFQSFPHAHPRPSTAIHGKIFPTRWGKRPIPAFQDFSVSALRFSSCGPFPAFALSRFSLFGFADPHSA